MVTKTHAFLAASNIFGVLPLIKAVGIFERSMILAVIAASVGMHLTETKHRLKPSGSFASKEDIFLNMDRGAAIFSLLYLGPRRLSHHNRGDILALFCGGLLFSAIGELTDNVKLYIACHIIWHLIAYSTMYMLL